MNIGILFGGVSREREISFAGGRTVYDNLDKSLFEAIPIFIDSCGHFIKLDWKYIYKGTIRDFFPPLKYIPNTKNSFQIYCESLENNPNLDWDHLIDEVGQRIPIEELKLHIDFAFLTLHGNLGEDGQIQGLLEFIDIPYTGSGILPSAIGIDKSFQKKIMDLAKFPTPKVMVISKKQWLNKNFQTIYSNIEKQIGFPCVVRPSNQGSSIGVSILSSDALMSDVSTAIDKAFFRYNLEMAEWKNLNEAKKLDFINKILDIRDGIGLPLLINNEWTYHPEDLLMKLNSIEGGIATLESKFTEQKVIVESFINGREFSCIVIRNEDGTAVALPPTEIIKGHHIYDYRSKYLPGLSRKQTPIEIDDKQLNLICSECIRLFELFEFNTYARIDGFINSSGVIYLNDPNTTSGMLPSSFFFHQAAEIGLNPSQFLTYIIRTSIWERNRKQLVISQKFNLLERIDNDILQLQTTNKNKIRVGVIMGGYSFERHISLESGRNIFEKLSSSDKYSPIPIFLLGDENGFDLYKIPINLMLKDNADDIKKQILNGSQHKIISVIRDQCKEIIAKYSSIDYQFHPKLISIEELKDEVDEVFIALHGRPGEDGTLQQVLDNNKIPYNGSGPNSSSLTINKYNTLQKLKSNGFTVTDQWIGYSQDYYASKEQFVSQIESKFDYPFIIKPVDDGCSSAVLRIKSQEQLINYLDALFRLESEINKDSRDKLNLAWNEEFPKKSEVLIEALIESNGAKQFMEITGGLLTKKTEDKIIYEIFEPSEVLVSGEILSLEEKFLAGEGQNITPPRFGNSVEEYNIIFQQVKAQFLNAAKILDIKGYARIDAFVRVYERLKVETIIIEVNSLPGMTPATCIFHQAALNGYKPYDFIDKILEFGMNEN